MRSTRRPTSSSVTGWILRQHSSSRISKFSSSSRLPATTETKARNRRHGITASMDIRVANPESYIAQSTTGDPFVVNGSICATSALSCGVPPCRGTFRPRSFSTATRASTEVPQWAVFWHRSLWVVNPRMHVVYWPNSDTSIRCTRKASVGQRPWTLQLGKICIALNTCRPFGFNTALPHGRTTPQCGRTSISGIE